MSVPKLRFKEFNGDWAKTTLGLLSDKIGDGIHATPDYDDQGEIPFINGNNLINGVVTISKTTKRINVSEFQNYKQNLSNQTIFLSINGTIGNLAFYQNEKFLLGKSVCFINLKQTVDKFFTYQILQSPQLKKTFNAELTGTTIKNLSLATVRNSKFFCPSQEEQTKLASFLSAVDEKISQLAQKNELLSQYKQGMMQKLFSQQIRFKADDGSEFGEWEEKIIKDIADVKGGKRIPKGYSLVNENTGHPYITVSDMNRLYSIDGMNIRYVPLEVVDIIKRYTITDKDIFISVAGTLGIIGKIPVKFNGANLTENADKLTNLRCHQDFLIYLLDSGYLSELIESTATTSAQPKLALYAIEQLEIKIPCLEEQTKIANFLSSIDQKIDVVAKQIEQAKTWKKGLLQQMFV
ncbi:restriction endonuclease subunit S [Acinetobacter guillouiae]|uniref:restriction endonuclease subunit S n=1 Tax=Acinetobacter guillouiae TaxID=106649 RepID=UPI001AE84F62|nr:restriction endonuclease subunit S [Acinetobacter guillouiae]MBP2544349.1 type I restriction enzyme S subunit [Acinetobacter guillouiae]